MSKAEIIARLEALTGPDREVDAALHRLLAGSPNDHWYDFFGKCVTDDTVPPVTASLDAAVALVERLLPGWGYYLRHDKDELANAGLTYPTHKFVTPCHCQAPTLPVAILIALFRALANEAHHD